MEAYNAFFPYLDPIRATTNLLLTLQSLSKDELAEIQSAALNSYPLEWQGSLQKIDDLLTPEGEIKEEVIFIFEEAANNPYPEEEGWDFEKAFQKINYLS